MTLLDLRTSLYVIFSILLVIYAALAVIASQVGGGKVSVGGLSPLHIYIFIVGIVGVKETLSYALGMSVRRRDYYWGVLIAGVLVAAVCSVAGAILSLVEANVLVHYGLQVEVFHMFGLQSTGPLGSWLADFIFLSFEFLFGFILALLYRRFGSSGLYILFGAVILSVAIVHLTDGWGPVLRWLSSLNSSLEAALWTLPAIAAAAAAAYGLLRRATV